MMTFTQLILFSFMLLGYSSTNEYKANISHCPDAKFKMGLEPGSSNNVNVPCLKPRDHSMCPIEFRYHIESVTWNLVAPEGMKNIHDICTRGSLYTEQYGELVQSSKVRSIILPQVVVSSKKKKKGVVKGQHVDMETEYIIKFTNKTYISNIRADFILEVIPKCKEDVEAWFCIKIPACIYQVTYGLCYKDEWNKYH